MLQIFQGFFKVLENISGIWGRLSSRTLYAATPLTSLSLGGPRFPQTKVLRANDFNTVESALHGHFGTF